MDGIGTVTAGTGITVNSLAGVNENAQAKKTTKIKAETDDKQAEQELIANTISMLAIGQVFDILKASPSSIEVEKARKEMFSENNPTAMDD